MSKIFLFHRGQESEIEMNQLQSGEIALSLNTNKIFTGDNESKAVQITDIGDVVDNIDNLPTTFIKNKFYIVKQDKNYNNKTALYYYDGENLFNFSHISLIIDGDTETMSTDNNTYSSKNLDNKFSSLQELINIINGDETIENSIEYKIQNAKLDCGEF